MLAVVRVHVVVRRETLAESDNGGLFTQIKVTIATDAGLLIHLARFLFEATNEQHLVVVVEQRIAIFPLRNGSWCLLANRCSILHICLLLALHIQITPDPFLPEAGVTT